MLSVIIITRNEEHNIARCLDSVKFASEVIIVDSGSTDKTLDIARQYTPHIYKMEDWRGFGIQKQRALDRARFPWVLNLDADEWVDATLQQAILTQIKADAFDAFQIPIKLQFYGKTLRYTSSPAHHVRLFKREGASYSFDIVHERVLLKPGAKVGKLKPAILHHCYQDVSHMISKLNKYSSYSAKLRLNKQRSASLAGACIGAGWMFFRSYFLGRGILDGKLGLLFSIYQAQGSFYRAVKQCYPDRHDCVS